MTVKFCYMTQMFETEQNSDSRDYLLFQNESSKLEAASVFFKGQKTQNIMDKQYHIQTLCCRSFISNLVLDYSKKEK